MAKAKKKSTHSRKPAAKASNENDPAPRKRPTRPVWQGNLRLSLVSCPVALFNATSRSSDVSFNLLNPETNNRIRMVPTDPDTGPVERSSLVKGYEISKNHYVIVTNEELDEVKLETTHTLEIERFVDASTIDRLYWNDPYFLVPQGNDGLDAYAVIREAMVQEDRIALGRVVMHTRERLMAIEPRGKGLLAYSLRMANEVVNPAEMFDDIPNAKVDPRMIDIAQKIIEQQEGPFEPKTFKDRYEEALRELIRRKEKGEAPVAAEPAPPPSNVVSLMDALQKSLQRKGASSAAVKPSAKAHTPAKRKRAR
ncbi:MAG: Ku protein [Alphaproteobacteria bacterium]|nr:Ku protein [Alphaproteobacteria bacterium]